MARVLMTDGQQRSTLAALRSLGRQRLSVDVGEDTWWCLSRFSRYRRGAMVYPSPKERPEAFAQWVLERLQRVHYDALMPMDDETTFLAGCYKEQLSRYTRVPVPDPQVFAKARNKARTLEIAMEAGIPCPKTLFPQGPEDARNLANTLEYPVLIKPRESSGSRGLVQVGSPSELAPLYAKVHQRYPQPLIQELIPRQTKYQVCALYNGDGQPRAALVQELIRDYPARGGPGTLFRSVVAPEVMELGLRLLSAMGWYGVAAVEFLVDERDGIPKLMEVNPRFWGTLALSILAGVDFPMLLYRMAMEGDIEPVTEYRSNIMCQWLLPGDMLHFLTNPDRLHMKPGLWPFGLHRPHYVVCSLRDPGPALGFPPIALRHIFDTNKWRETIKRSP